MVKRESEKHAHSSASTAKSFAGSRGGSAFATSEGAGSGLNLDDDCILAYMLNNNHELVWFNEAARAQLFGFTSLHPSSEMRNIFLLLSSVPSGVDRELVTLHASIAKPSLSRMQVAHSLRLADDDRADQILDLFQAAPAEQSYGSTTINYSRVDSAGTESHWQAVCIFFREGTLCAHVPAEASADILRQGLSNRGDLIRQLASRQAPLLTPLGVLVADLQNSVKICAELLPQDYFALINQIWGTIGPIVRKYHGQISKHAGDGMVAYFFPHSESHYLADAAACALEVKAAIRRVSKEWQIERHWANELYMNIGVHDGQEWLGAIQLGDNIEFTALGDTINTAARLCDMASYGSIWASKSFVTRLQSETRDKLDFGVERTLEADRRQFVPQSFAQVASLMPGDASGKWQDLGTLAVTEIIAISQ
ncbi:MAG: hypothetical protein RL425_894 [Pseudomonadota bacterium]